MSLRLSVRTLFAFALAAVLPTSWAQGAASTEQPMNCDMGPLMKTFGQTNWLVYACSDGHSVAIMSAPGSPASPFYFMFHSTNQGYRLVGEGTGSKDATAKAHAELRAMSQKEITALFAEARKVGRK